MTFLSTTPNYTILVVVESHRCDKMLKKIIRE